MHIQFEIFQRKKLAAGSNVKSEIKIEVEQRDDTDATPKKKEKIFSGEKQKMLQTEKV